MSIKKIVIAAALVSATLSASAYARIEGDCERQYDLAHQIMSARQKGVTKGDMEGVVSSKIGLEIIRQAFEAQNVQISRRAQEIEKFANRFERQCEAVLEHY
jgi:HAMP domain-containing protein